MKVIRYRDRDIILWKMPDGKLQPFYKSSGRNSGKPGTWFPFDGWEPIPPGVGWFVKRRFGQHRFAFPGSKYQKVSEEIVNLQLPAGKEVITGEAVNTFLREQGWKSK